MGREPVSAPDLSICIVNWNTCDLLRDCLASIAHTRSRTSLEVEVIVSDNGSTDGSTDMVRDEFPDARLIENGENLLFARGSNVAADQAAGRYVLFLNSDTIVDCAELAKLVAVLEERAAAAVCGPRLVDASGAPAPALPPFPAVWPYVKRLLGLSPDRLPDDGDEPVRVQWVTGACLLIQADAGRALRFFDEDFPFYANAADLCYRAWRSGREVWYVPSAEVIHLLGRSTERRPDAERMLAREVVRGRLTLIAKHNPPLRAWLLKTLFVAFVYRSVLTRALASLLALGRSPKRRRRLHEARQLLAAVRCAESGRC